MFKKKIVFSAELENKNISSLATNLRKISEFGYVDEDAIREALAKEGEFNFIDGNSGIKVDFWVKGKDVLNAEGFRRCVLKDIAGQKINFISPEDLILSKLKWYKISSSSRHLEDIDSIIKISGEILDKKYLKKMSIKSNLSDELEKILK